MNKINYTSKCCGTVELTSRLVAKGVPFPNSENESKTVHNKFKVTVRTDKDTRSFDYYMSQADHNAGIVVMSNKDILRALAAILEDAKAGKMSFNEFCSDYGYDKDSNQARDIYDSCINSLDKVRVLFGNIDLDNFMDTLESEEEKKDEEQIALQKFGTRYDLSTINLNELRKLPKLKLPATYSLQHDPGNGCLLEPPGHPKYYTQSVYNASGNRPAKGPQMVILGHVLETASDKPEAMEARIKKLWKPLPIDHPRTVAWKNALYAYMNHCYYDQNHPEKTLIYPVPYYNLKKFSDDIRFSEEWRQKEKASIEQANKEIISYAEKIAVPENHQAVRSIRDHYPDYKPELDLIKNPPESSGNWWERLSEKPKPENCPGQYGMKHPVNGSWCQMCGWHATIEGKKE